MLLILTATVAVCLLLAVCFGLGELVFGWPQATCYSPPNAARSTEPDPTGCGYAYRAIGVGLAMAIAITIALGLLTGSVRIGMLAAAAGGAFGACVRGWRMWKQRGDGAGAGAVCSAPLAGTPPVTGQSGIADLFGPERPATRRDHVLLVALVGATLIFFLGAEFRSARLFDPDANDHAVCVRWLLDQDNLVEPSPDRPVLHYIDAYPPGFDLTAAALGHLCGGRAAFPLRLLNALLIALAVGWLHGLVLELTRRPRLALLAAFFIVMAPNNLTHFIWSHTLAVGWLPLLATLGCRVIRRSRAELVDSNKPDSSTPAEHHSPTRDIFATALVLGGICLVSPVPGIKAIFWAALPGVAAALQRNWTGVRNTLLAGCLAGCIALIWWGPMFAKYGSYQALWRAQLAPVIVERADTEQWTAPAATDVVGTGDVGINLKVHFWGWDHVGMGSETSASALSLGWSQTILTLLGVSIALGAGWRRWRSRVAAAPGSDTSTAVQPEPGPPNLAAADLVMGLFLAFSAFGFLGPLHGIEFYSYRFILLLPIPCAYFQARGLAALVTADLRQQLTAAGLTALALFAALFGYGLFVEWSYWQDFSALLLLIGWPMLGLAVALRPNFQPLQRWGFMTAGILILFSLFAGGLNRFYLNYLPPIPNTYLDMIGKTSEGALVDSLSDRLPVGTSVYMAGGMECRRFVVAQEMRSPLLSPLEDAGLERALIGDPAGFLNSLRAMDVHAVVVGPSFQRRLPREANVSVQDLQRRIVAIQQALVRQPGVTVIADLPSENPSMAGTVLVRLNAP